jgi:hypothetical protein
MSGQRSDHPEGRNNRKLEGEVRFIPIPADIDADRVDQSTPIAHVPMSKRTPIKDLDSLVLRRSHQDPLIKSNVENRLFMCVSELLKDFTSRESPYNDIRVAATRDENILLRV